MEHLDFSKDIRFKEGLMWHGSTKPRRMIRAAAVLQTITILAAVTLAVIAIANYLISKALSDELVSVKQQSQIHKSEADNWLKQLVTCLNGGTLYDKASNTAFFCAKPIEVKL